MASLSSLIFIFFQILAVWLFLREISRLNSSSTEPQERNAPTGRYYPFYLWHLNYDSPVKMNQLPTIKMQQRKMQWRKMQQRKMQCTEDATHGCAKCILRSAPTSTRRHLSILRGGSQLSGAKQSRCHTLFPSGALDPEMKLLQWCNKNTDAPTSWK